MSENPSRRENAPVRAAAAVLGRARETELLVAALDAGAHVILEGPPGTGKSTLLRAVAEGAGAGFVFVEGNAELTPARLVGHFDPSRLLADGYVPSTFVDGPLVEALRSGSLLYVEEINRVPEETVNVLITVMSEGELHVPRLGRVPAEPGFRVVAAMNPFDSVGTARISGAIYDRVCRITMGYQSAEDESAIVALRAASVAPSWRARIVEVVRSTRSHPDVRVGSSVRGAIDLVGVATSLAKRRNKAIDDWHLGLDAAQVALSGRMRLHESCARPPEAVVRELWERVFGKEPQPDAADRTAPDDEPPGERPGPPGPSDPGAPPDAPPGHVKPRAKERGQKQSTVARTELARNPRFAEVSPEVGVLDEDAFDRALAADAESALAMLADMAGATDEKLRAAARRLASKLVLDLSRRGAPVGRGIGRLRPAPVASGGELDVDASLAPILEGRALGIAPDPEQLVARAWARPALAVCLLVDRSGSMGGARLAAAALTAAACAWRAPGDHAVVAFAKDVTVLRAMGSDRPTAAVIDAVLGLRGHGMTALASALAAASEQLERTRAARRVVVLLSDCRASDDVDPAPIASRLPELVVLAPAGDTAQAAELARRSGARWAELPSAADAPALIAELLG